MPGMTLASRSVLIEIVVECVGLELKIGETATSMLDLSA